MIKLLITDLDDTLYSWIGFFIPAFYGMVEELSHILNKESTTLLKEYKQIHQQKGSVEYPYATLYLPSVVNAYPGDTPEERLQKLDTVFHRFNSIRKKHLELYPHVKATLTQISQMGIKIVGYTESAEENGFYRLQKLGIAHLFQHVYVSDSQYERPDYLPSSEKTRVVHGKKPNPELLRQICVQESVPVTETVYIGDSITKDIYMAKVAGVTSVLCKYPCDPQAANDLYQKLVTISHWTDEDFQREKEIKQICQSNDIRPDYTVDSFKQLIDIIRLFDEINSQA